MELPATTDPFPKQHEMCLEAAHPSGAQEWSCPSCARRFVVQFGTKVTIIMLEAGNEGVSHTGSTTDSLRLGPPRPSKSEEETALDDLWAQIEEALKDIDFDDW